MIAVLVVFVAGFEGLKRRKGCLVLGHIWYFHLFLVAGGGGGGRGVGSDGAGRYICARLSAIREMNGKDGRWSLHFNSNIKSSSFGDACPKAHIKCFAQ